MRSRKRQRCCKGYQGWGCMMQRSYTIHKPFTKAPEYAFSTVSIPITGMVPFHLLHSEPAASTRYAYMHYIVYTIVDQHLWMTTHTYASVYACAYVYVYVHRIHIEFRQSIAWHLVDSAPYLQ